MKKFAQYLEARDLKLHDQIIDEGIVGDAAKWVGDKAKGAYQGAKDFFGEFMSRLKDQFGDFKTDMSRLKELDKEHKLDQMKRDIDEAEKLGNEEHKKEVRKRWFKWLVTAGVVIVTALTVSAGHAHGGGPLDGPLVKNMPDKTGLDGIQKTTGDASHIGSIPLKSFTKLGDKFEPNTVKFELENMAGSGLLKFKNALEKEGNFSNIFQNAVQKSGVKEAISVANELVKISRIGTSDGMEIVKILKSEISKDATLKDNPEFKILAKSFGDDTTKNSDYTKKIEDHIKKDKADSEKSAADKEVQAKRNSANQEKQKKTSDQFDKDYAVKKQENEKTKSEILKTGSSEIIKKIHDSSNSAVKSLSQKELDNIIIKTFKDQGDKAGIKLTNIISMKGALGNITSKRQTDDYGNMKFTSGPEFVKDFVKKLGSSPETMKELDRIYKGGQDGSHKIIGKDFGYTESMRECLVLAGLSINN